MTPHHNNSHITKPPINSTAREQSTHHPDRPTLLTPQEANSSATLNPRRSIRRLPTDSLHRPGTSAP